MKVLSIDFDIVMAPDINLYNNFVPRIVPSIDEIVEHHPYLGGLRADLDHYQKIANLLLKVGADIKYTNVCASLSHEHIGKFLMNDNDLEIVNIDHHHDLGYIEDDTFEKCNCANWAYYLFKQGKLKRYIWLNNVNSDIMPPHRHEDCFSSQHFCDIEVSDYIQQFGKPDKIFLCLSSPWVPSQYFPLFYLLLDILNHQNNYVLPVY